MGHFGQATADGLEVDVEWAAVRIAARRSSDILVELEGI